MKGKLQKFIFTLLRKIPPVSYVHVVTQEVSRLWHVLSQKSIYVLNHVWIAYSIFSSNGQKKRENQLLHCKVLPNTTLTHKRKNQPSTNTQPPTHKAETHKHNPVSLSLSPHWLSANAHIDYGLAGLTGACIQKKEKNSLGTQKPLTKGAPLCGQASHQKLRNQTLS